jgi:precorrin-2 dehydrogenase/sirohydrochlorin ferrochelatase
MFPFFPVSLNLIGRQCVVIGARDDREAIEKEAALREAGANVTRVAEHSMLRDEDVSGAFFVISTPQNAELSARLRALADEHGFLLCCIDQPSYGFVAMAAIAKAGPVRIAVSTTGQAPAVAKRIKERLQGAMDERFARFVEAIAAKKRRAAEEHPGDAGFATRRKTNIAAAEGFDADVSFTYPDWFKDEPLS